jgi:hypothetical protein
LSFPASPAWLIAATSWVGSRGSPPSFGTAEPGT